MSAGLDPETSLFAETIQELDIVGPFLLTVDFFRVLKELLQDLSASSYEMP